ncbi:MAG: cbb3-type cytochrome c oxidase subunit I [Gemmatimonadales bacterium]
MSEPRRRYHLLAWLVLLAIAACALTIMSGLGAALTYTDLEPTLRSAGLTLQHFRAIHETFAFAWVFVGGASVVYLYLHANHGSLSTATRQRFAWQLVLWSAAGVGILISLLTGHFTGREYLEYHPFFSVLIVAGWLLFAWNYFSYLGGGLKGQPVYIYMWSIGIGLFVISFTEGHLYLLDFLSARPERDLAVQWKSNGTLVGAFNQIVYGSLMYVAGKISGDDSYAHSRTAFALFVVGALNTFTNYGHHTYHLPQTPVIHWISFLVSMLEVIILAKVFLDLLSLRRGPGVAPEHRTAGSFIHSATVWTFSLLIVALLISVPPLNALIHGTHVVVAHSMGSMIGIDSMILWAALSYTLWYIASDRTDGSFGRRVYRAVPPLNTFLAVFLISYLLRGAAAGWTRYAGATAGDFSQIFILFPAIMVVSGLGVAICTLWILLQWLVAVHRTLTA